MIQYFIFIFLFLFYKDAGYTIGGWFIEHDTMCSNHQLCSKGWYFFFSNDKQRIQLQHNTFIIWKANDPQLYHGTTEITNLSNSKCCPQQWAFNIQTKKSLVNAITNSSGEIVVVLPLQ